MIKLTEKQQELADLMSDISEHCYYAGWITGNEFVLWGMLVNPEKGFHFGVAEVDIPTVERLHAIHKEIGGWIYWHDRGHEPECPFEEVGERFIPTEAWLVMFDQYGRPGTAP